MRPATGWMANFTFTRAGPAAAPAPRSCAGLRHGHAVTRHDHHAFCVGHHRRDIRRFNRLRAPLIACASAGATTEVGEQHIADRPVHRLGHQPGQQDAGGADHHARDDQCLVAQHVAFERHRQAGERVVQRDHHRHVGATDRQRHQHAQRQRQYEEGDDRPGAERAGGDDRQHHHGQRHQQVHHLLAGPGHALVQAPIQLGPGNHRTGQRHGTDRRADHRQQQHRARRLARPGRPAPARSSGGYRDGPGRRSAAVPPHRSPPPSHRPCRCTAPPSAACR